MVLATLAVFWRVQYYPFIQLDDKLYITENPFVMAGLTLNGIGWAFTTLYAANWHPLTWLSHMLDVEVYGLNSGGHHLTSLFLHIANVLLLFYVLRRMTGALWPCVLVALLFAIHPLHVESVTWVAERKDVLGAFFAFLTLWAYQRYTERPVLSRYLWVFLVFCLGLMAKPMLVTLPFVLLLLDYWPLGRVASIGLKGAVRENRWRVLWEKVPLFILSAGSSLITYLAQQKGEAVSPLGTLSIEARIGNALVSYASYIAKMFCPTDLAVFYPHPDTQSVGLAIASALLLTGVSFFVLWKGRSYPYLPVGWFWYLGTLVPVIGLVQVGMQAMADRYTYLPLVGLFIMLAWALSELTAKEYFPRMVPVALVAILLSILAILSELQVGYWRDSITLFGHAIRVTDRNYLAHDLLGTALAEEGRSVEAAVHFSEAIEIKPNYEPAHYSLGNVLMRWGRLEEAVDQYSQALSLKPGDYLAHDGLGIAFAREGRFKEAVDHYSQALRIKPDYELAHYNLGIAFVREGRLEEAVDQYSQALLLKPDDLMVHNNLGAALVKQGRLEEGISHFSQALLLQPHDALTHYNLGMAYKKQARLDSAVREFEAALEDNPRLSQARDVLEAIRREKENLKKIEKNPIEVSNE